MNPAEKALRYLAEHREEVEFLEREGMPYAAELLRLAQRGKEVGSVGPILLPLPTPSPEAKGAA